MRKSPLVLLVVLSLAGVAGCGSSDDGDEGGGFTESDRQAAREFVSLKATSPGLDTLWRRAHQLREAQQPGARQERAQGTPPLGAEISPTGPQIR